MLNLNAGEGRQPFSFQRGSGGYDSRPAVRVLLHGEARSASCTCAEFREHQSCGHLWAAALMHAALRRVPSSDIEPFSIQFEVN